MKKFVVGLMLVLLFSSVTNVFATDQDILITDYTVADGQTDDTEGFQAALDAAAKIGAKVRSNYHIYRLDGPIRFRKGVDMSLGGSVLDARGANQYGASIYADEKLSGEKWEGFTITHTNNPLSNVVAFQAYKGASSPNWRFIVIAKKDCTATCVIINGFDPIAQTPNNNLYSGQLDLIFASTDYSLIEAVGLQLGERFDMDMCRANAWIVRGSSTGLSKAYFFNGQSISFQACINVAVTGVHFYGNGCFSNHILAPAYFDSSISGNKVVLENTGNKPNIMVTVEQVPGLYQESSVCELPTTYPGLKLFNGQIYTSAVPLAGAGKWNAGTKFTNRNQKELGVKGAMYIVEGWVVTPSGTRQLRYLTGN